MVEHGSDIFNRDFLDAIRRMAYVAEYRKANTLSHIERIRGYCFVIANRLGLPLNEAKIISYASQLHDIGEIVLVDSLLSRNGKLTPYEWELVKRHPTVGAEILKGSSNPIMKAGEIIALTHHERWDGTGYPQGLREEGIPLGGRICTLADVFDALTSKRSYKEEISPEQALQLIQDSSGQYFDPSLVKVFTNHFDEIIEIRRMNT
jgi:putative two-component system response regulator